MVTDEMIEKAQQILDASFQKDYWISGPPEEATKRALEAALSAAESDELYNADALMNDGGNNRQTAAEEVLTYLLIEVVGAPDDVPYSANRAGVLIEERLNQKPAPSVAVKALRDNARFLVDRVSHHGSIAVVDQDLIDGLRDAVNEFDALSAQVQDDWTVSDTECASEILLLLGIGSDPSKEPGADWRRDKVAKIIRRHIDDRSAQVQDVAGCLPEEVHEAATEVITAHECGMLRQTIWWETAAFLLAEYTMKAGDYAAAPAKQEGGE
ncbi:hypothetical protein G3A56_01490 [Rhizobium oryzihabitans]|uniref:Uncharacterized protein n=1 Tax=Rhizobium oryzihabitans TaxID=2267833 RepID=A0A7L5BDM3_9HYPH|nr:hypothetical protein [Rhizobium oryzihabitans]QIB36833.1 hypothetical protein G3A56_01490 [Rhizobium oryzihabitans]